MFGFEKNKVLEQWFEFLENGGYYVDFTYRPRNKFVKILGKLRLVRPRAPTIEVYDAKRYFFLEIKQIGPNLFRGYFMAEESSKKRLTFSVNKKVSILYTMKAFVNKVSN